MPGKMLAIINKLLKVLINKVYNQLINKDEQFHLQAIMVEIKELNSDVNLNNMLNNKNKIKQQSQLVNLWYKDIITYKLTSNILN